MRPHGRVRGHLPASPVISANPVLPQPRASAWEWTQVVLLAANLTWTTLCLGGFRAETMVITIALTGAMFAVHCLERAATRRAIERCHLAGWLFVPFLIYAAANVRWVSPVPWLGWRDWLGWAQMIAVFWVVLNGVRSKGPRVALFGVLVAIGMVAVGLGFYQEFVRPGWLMMGRTQALQFLGRASGPFGAPNSLAALLLLLLPATGGLVLRRRTSAVARVLWAYVIMVFAFGLVLTISRGAWISLGLALILWPVLAVRGNWKRKTMVSAGAALLLVGISSVLIAKVPGIRERFVSLKENAGELSRPIMWRGAWKIFTANPLLGGGAGSFDVRFDRYRPTHFQDRVRWAHNDYLNTLSDYGATGAVLFFGAWAVIGVGCIRRAKSATRRDWLDSRFVAGGMVAGLAAFALQLFVEFHFKIPALAIAFATMAGLTVQHFWRVREASPVTPIDRTTATLTAVAALAGTVCCALPIYRAEALRNEAREAIDGLARRRADPSQWPHVLDPAVKRLAQAVDVDPANGEAWADLAYATALGSRFAPEKLAEIGREAENAGNRALALSEAVPEFWVRRGVALDLQGRWYEAGRMFIRALKLAPARSTIWYYHAFHLSMDPIDPGRAVAAVNYCLRLDPNNPEGQTLRRRLTEAGSH